MSAGHRYCAYDQCGDVLYRTPGETAGNWRRRRFCNRSCAAHHRERWLDRVGRAHGAAKRLPVLGESPTDPPADRAAYIDALTELAARYPFQVRDLVRAARLRRGLPELSDPADSVSA